MPVIICCRRNEVSSVSDISKIQFLISEMCRRSLVMPNNGPFLLICISCKHNHARRAMATFLYSPWFDISGLCLSATVRNTRSNWWGGVTLQGSISRPRRKNPNFIQNYSRFEGLNKKKTKKSKYSVCYLVLFFLVRDLNFCINN